MTNEKLPTVWLYWEGKKPPLVDLCIRSIQRHNPTARLIGPADVAGMEGSEELRAVTRRLNPTLRSNLLRLWLVWKHGGVWVDADTICTAPIELVSLAADHDLDGVRNPGFAARETPLGGRAGSPIFAEAYRRYAQVLRTYRRRKPLDRLLRAHMPIPAADAKAITLPDARYYPLLYGQISIVMRSPPTALNPAIAVLWPINHFVYRRFAHWTEPRLMRCRNFLGQALRYAFREEAQDNGRNDPEPTP